MCHLLKDEPTCQEFSLSSFLLTEKWQTALETGTEDARVSARHEPLSSGLLGERDK